RVGARGRFDADERTADAEADERAAHRSPALVEDLDVARAGGVERKVERRKFAVDEVDFATYGRSPAPPRRHEPTTARELGEAKPTVRIGRREDRAGPVETSHVDGCARGRP